MQRQIAIAEFGDKLPQPGDVFPVFYEGLDDNDTAMISKRCPLTPSTSWAGDGTNRGGIGRRRWVSRAGSLIQFCYCTMASTYSERLTEHFGAPISPNFVW